jgi:EpsI family protein
MRTLKQRFIISTVAIAVVAPLALTLFYTAPESADAEPLKRLLPATLGSWTYLYDREPTPEEIRILETKAIITRTYGRGGDRTVDLSVTYAPDNRRVAHPPELCYKGGGWTVEDHAVLDVPLEDGALAVNRLLLIRGGHRLVLLYWFKAGPVYTEGYWHMQWLNIWNQLLNRRSSSALLRVSAMSPGPAEDDVTTDMLRQFAALALPHITRAVR